MIINRLYRDTTDDLSIKVPLKSKRSKFDEKLLNENYGSLASKKCLQPLRDTYPVSLNKSLWKRDGQGGSRTLTALRPQDFKSCVYAIPPLAQ